MKYVLLLMAVVSLSGIAHAGGKKDSTRAAMSPEDQQKMEKLTTYLLMLDSVDKVTKYQTGTITIPNSDAHLVIPSGFKFMDAERSRYVIETLWKNLPNPSVLGMIVKDSFRLTRVSDWVFVVTYENIGYVKDDDASKVQYDELLSTMKKDQETANEERKKLGLDQMHLIGWATPPFYDKNNKVLYWAKSIAVDGSTDTTLNYDVRVLGRKGVLNLNAVATIDQLADVKKNIPAVLQMAQFNKGSTYGEFDSGADKVAAWTIGGLVAGKILAKVGFFALILKFWKLLALAVGGGFAAVKRFFTGRKKETDLPDDPAPMAG